LPHKKECACRYKVKSSLKDCLGFCLDVSVGTRNRRGSGHRCQPRNHVLSYEALHAGEEPGLRASLSRRKCTSPSFLDYSLLTRTKCAVYEAQTAVEGCLRFVELSVACTSRGLGQSLPHKTGVLSYEGKARSKDAWASSRLSVVNAHLELRKSVRTKNSGPVYGGSDARSKMPGA